MKTHGICLMMYFKNNWNAGPFFLLHGYFRRKKKNIYIIAACRKIWEQRTDQEPPTECLVEMLTLVLKNNNFTFDGNHYLQINGTAMGTKMAPSYANIFMGDLEERLLLSSLKQPLSWFRFIDDVDMKWTHGDKELDEFLEHANSIHPSIKFTHEVSKTKMSFLDTTTTVKGGQHDN